ncbi:porin family protein [Chachezhania sediminis]|uniref:hypothetical protein n=1 Tax=Chachezhania sediminis TaxID=2599291 RepID=UPI00131B4F42|nr:hypothetical protein [Chachezhania sediminis]
MFRSLAFAGAIALAGPAAAQTASQWTGQATAYVWGAGVGGDVTPFSGAPTVSFDRSLSEVLKDSDEFLFLSGFARRGNLVLFADLSYSSSSRSGLVPPGIPASGKLSQRSMTLAAGKRVVNETTQTVDVMAGLRAWRVEGEVSVPLAGVSVSPTKSFVDPIIAARTNITLAPRWSVIGYADVGGFGAGSDLTYQVVVTANFQATENLFLSAGFRQLYLDYDSGGTAFNVTMAGPVLGATWRF